jgi:ribosome-binding protein aMBF1 (putative translation factor)
VVTQARGRDAFIFRWLDEGRESRNGRRIENIPEREIDPEARPQTRKWGSAYCLVPYDPGCLSAVDRYIGARMREQRLALNMSQAQLGGELGVSFQQIQKYERGVNRG